MKKILALSVILVSSAAWGNVLVNGSFEGSFTSPQGDGALGLNSGSTTIPGWTTISAELTWINNVNSYSLSASDGSKSLDLTGYHDALPYGGVQQSITTAIGTPYILSFDIGGNYQVGLTKSIEATAGNVSQQFDFVLTSASQSWKHVELPFVATSSSTVISLVGKGVGGVYIGLDNVSVDAVPEPSGAMLAAVTSMALIRRRR